MRRSGLDFDRTWLLLVEEAFLNVFLNTGKCACLLTECDIVFIGEYPPESRFPVADF